MKNKITLLIIISLFLSYANITFGQNFSVSTNQSVSGGTWYLEVIVERVTSTTDRFSNASLAFEFGSQSGLNFTNAPSDASSGWTNLTTSYGSPDIMTTNFGNGNSTFPKYVYINLSNSPSWANCIDWASVSNTIKIVRISLPVSNSAKNSECNWHSNPLQTVCGAKSSANVFVSNDRNTSIPFIFESIASGTPLPVELATFSAKQTGEQINITWQTKTEVNNYGFEVERSVDSKVWSKLGFIKGSGNSNSPKNYSFTDKSYFGGTKLNYRLKQIDNDGKIVYSNVEEIEYKPTSYELYQNFPNPFNPTTKISFALPESGNITLKVFNTLGEEVATLVNGFVEAGMHSINFNANNLTTGLYIYRLSSDKATFTKKMVLMK
jgi:hypothetical protein